MRVVYNNDKFNVNILSSEVERNTLFAKVIEGVDCDDNQFIGKPFTLNFAEKNWLKPVYEEGLSIGDPDSLEVELDRKSKERLLNGYYLHCWFGIYSFEFNVKH